MYQVAHIDTAVITPVDFAAASASLPEVTANGVVAQSTQKLDQSSNQPLSSTILSSDSTTGFAENLPSIEVMLHELKTSGVLNPELGLTDPNQVTQQPDSSTPLVSATSPNGTPVILANVSPVPPSAPTMMLANTATIFERPHAEQLLYAEEPHFKLSFSLLMGLLGIVIVFATMGLAYREMRYRGLSHQEILDTTIQIISSQ